MATLVLTAVGSAIGGPIGGAIGAAIGQQVDLALFAPKPREGARLKELAVQTSSYGTAIPAIFGAMRVAGTVIWATDLVERRTKSGGAKGRPATVSYSYSVSMAVALSSRPIGRIGRIWADGNLLRGEAGDLKVDAQLRVHDGYDDQRPDPLMASAETLGQCPGHRGMSYVVFEDLQLADFGNRIPSLTFEVFEREAAVPVQAIFEAALRGRLSGASNQAISGFALSGADARDGMTPLLEVLPVDLAAREGRLTLKDRGALAGTVMPITVSVAENSEIFEQPQQSIASSGKVSGEVVLRYYDRDRDYQAGVQRSGQSDTARNVRQIELPAVMDAIEARRLVERKGLEARFVRTAWTGNIACSSQPICAGDYFVDDAGATWKIDEIEHRFGTIAIKARTAVAITNGAGTNGVPGRHLPPPDLAAGETRLAIIDLPIFDGADPGKPLLAIFAAGTGTGWKRAALSLRTDAGLLEIGSTSAPAVIGVTLNALGSHTPLLIDNSGYLDVELLNSSMDIADRDSPPTAVDAPYFWMEGEFVRVGRVTALGNNVYRLSRFLRAHFSADLAVPSHVAGNQIMLLESDAARLITEQLYSRGQPVEVEAMGLGDQLPVTAATTVKGLAITPLAPVHGVARADLDGSIELTWKRRSRVDAGWLDGVDQALAEDRESYLVSLLADGVPATEWTVGESRLLVSGSAIAAMDLPANAALSFDVRQIGQFAQSASLNIGIS